VVDANEPAVDDEQPGLIARYGQLYDEELPESDRADRLAHLLVEVFRESGVAGDAPARPQAPDRPSPSYSTASPT
jgi:hypothetical protein